MNERDMNTKPTGAREIERKAQALVAVVFLLGLIIGGLGTHYWQVRAAGDNSKHSLADLNRKPTHAEILNQLTHDLSLTDDQQKQVSTIMDDVHSRMRSLDDQHKPEYDALRAEGRQRIRAVLTEEQQPKYTEFTKQLDEQRAKAQKER